MSKPCHENRKMMRAAGVVGAATLLSRILGFARDVVIAWFLGAGMYSDAFFVAFRIPNLLRRLFAEGSLTIAFIPVFTQYLAQGGKREAFALAGATFKALCLLLIAVVIAGILTAPWIVRVIAPGFVDQPDKMEMTVLLTRMLFPYILLISLVALAMGVLNALGHFAAPALAPAVLNISMIGAVWLLSGHFRLPVMALAVGVIAGGIFQLLLQLPPLLRFGLTWRGPWRHDGLRQIGRLMAPAVFGAAVYQINILVGTLLASMLIQGSISYLYYADRLVQFPLGIFAVALATAVLPSLSRQAAADDAAGLARTLAYSIRLVFFISLPAMAGLIMLREPIVNMLFQRGAFDNRTAELTAVALLNYSVGLWAFSAVRIVVSTFYALQDTRTPVVTAAWSVAANMVLGLVLMKPMGHGGLALATSLASMINLCLLALALRRRIPRLPWSQMGISVLRTAVNSLAMAVAIYGLCQFLGHSWPALILIIGLGGCIYITLSAVTRSPEMDGVLQMIKERLRG